MKFRQFYEGDWAAKDGAPPEVDETLTQRQNRIARAATSHEWSLAS